ncbi:MAG: hypothetical protein MRY79_07145 [Alphaproteobacteria bacterium]|nr:hypothetical protein [Alphaproteobacteria bacterium]
MKFKEIAKKLAKVRDNVRSEGHITDKDKEVLQALVRDKIAHANESLEKLPKCVSGRIAIPGNDNSPLTHDQNFRLRLMEKTGTGSETIH